MTHSVPDKTESPWTLTGQQADLAVDGIHAAVDLNEPAIGLTNVTVLGSPLPADVFGVRHADHHADGWGDLSDAYHRDEDLVSVYDQTDRCPFRTTLNWRAVGGLADKSHGVTLDMILSVQTNLLDVTPKLETRSWFSDAEVVIFPPTADGSHLDLDRGTVPSDLVPETAIGCVMLRLARLDATYCELIHPSDWRGLSIRRDDGQVELSWSLVGHFMEKGVIRRLRVRGHFLAGRAKEQRVADLYAAFAESPPPLTT